MNLTDYLKLLAMDPVQRTTFQKDPAAHMRGAGLSQAHQNVINSKDPKQIAAAVIDENPLMSGQLAFTFYVYIVIHF